MATRSLRVLFITGAAILLVYLLLLGLLWLAHVRMVVRFASVVRGPLDMLLSFPAVAAYLTGALVVGASRLSSLTGGLTAADVEERVEESALWPLVRRVPGVEEGASREALRAWVDRYRAPLIPVVNATHVKGVVRAEDLWQEKDISLRDGAVVRADEPLGRLLDVLAEEGAAVLVRGEDAAYVGILTAADAVWVWRRSVKA